jgi:hypothetical protein
MKQTQIFISYQHSNQQFAYKLYNDLLSDGYWVWVDRRIEPAKEWEPQIDENLRKSKILIALISSKSVKSDWVKHEGSMAFALNQLIIPVKIEPFGTYSAADLPIWAAKIQLLDIIEGATDYDDHFQELKQKLGEPLPIRQHLEEMLLHYKNSGMLLDEVALALIERHYDELHLPKDMKALADKLIEESRRNLDKYWIRYAKLEKHYENALMEIQNLIKTIESKTYDSKFQLAFIMFLCTILAFSFLAVIFLYFK